MSFISCNQDNNNTISIIAIVTVAICRYGVTQAKAFPQQVEHAV